MHVIKHYHVNYCPMSKVDDKGQCRVKSCPGKSMLQCEHDGLEKDCHLTSTDIICNNFECQVLKKLDDTQMALEDSRSEIAKLKRINTEYRLIMHIPDAVTAERFIKSGTIDFSGIKGIINSHRKSWDSCDDTTLIYNCEFAQKIAEAYAQYIHERSSKIRIKEIVAEKGKQETKAAIKKVDDDKEAAAKAKAKLSPYGKALAGYIKIGMKEEAARAILKSMGLKE